MNETPEQIKSEIATLDAQESASAKATEEQISQLRAEETALEIAEHPVVLHPAPATPVFSNVRHRMTAQTIPARLPLQSLER